ncbi:chaplin family protein [Streptomyces sp. NPDC049813]|uniref:chaplin n=1 Tax=Streptomyces sp. NPDC049813 TaxID=3365597 RepID=UPI003792C97D
MRQVTRKGLITVAAASGVLAVTGGYAHADSGAQGGAANSPGVASGNSVQAPVHVPVNLCGNTVNVIGLLNPAMGNNCANTSGGHGDHGGYGGHGGHHGHGGHDSRGGGPKPSGGGSGGAHAGGSTSNSPGVGSGNHVQAPIDIPANVCGNSVSVIGLLDPATGNDCANPAGHAPTPPRGPEKPPSKPHQPGTPETRGGHPVGQVAAEKPNQPRPQALAETESVAQPRAESQLAMTGSSLPIGVAVPVGAGALLAGAVLYRRARASV